MENREALRPFDVLDCIRAGRKVGASAGWRWGIKVFLSYHAEKDIFLGYALEMAEKFLKAPKG
ncbi:hypothetical protein [uncultured Bilophila sp.]|uniref:hypothetical protein n=1 Tax=uncultured Bilophila sp. TaxID=529385 RepID=UPI00266FB0C5|nr:hypothetical protein [uncultured Bilophila sp.]